VAELSDIQKKIIANIKNGRFWNDEVRGTPSSGGWKNSVLSLERKGLIVKVVPGVYALPGK